MATEKKYLDVDGLNVYTELIKGKIGDMQTVIDNIALDDDLKAAFGDDWNAGSNPSSNPDSGLDRNI